MSDHGKGLSKKGINHLYMREVGESNLASNQVPMYSPQSGTLILKGTKLITNTKKQRLKI